MQSEIKRWGNSAAVRLSSKVLAMANLNIASLVNIQVKDGSILIEPIAKTTPRIKLPFTEAALLKGLNARTAHADEIALPTSREMGEDD